MSVLKYKSLRLNSVLFDKNNLHKLKENDPDLINFICEWLDEKDYIETFTSGTTGEPKKIRLKKQHMINSAILTRNFFGLSSENTALLCLPVRYIAGKMMVVRGFVTGLNLITVKPSSNPLKGLRNSFDFIAMTPHQLFNSVEEVERLKINTIIIGGSDTSPGLEKKINDLSTKIYSTYGMTETCSHVALRRINGENVQSVFEALDNVKFQKDDRDCLVIRAPGVSDTVITTNDVVELIDDTHFKWLGRIDNVINTGGIKIFSEEIEKKISGLLSKPYFIGSLPDEKLTEKITLFIEGKPDTAKDNLLVELKKCLLKHELPKEIVYLNEFFYSQSGKILRKETVKSVKHQTRDIH